jgi:hypothetical protein
MPQNPNRATHRRPAAELAAELAADPCAVLSHNRAKIAARLLLLRIPGNYAGAAGSHMQPFFFGRRPARNDTRFLIANLEFRIAASDSKQRTRPVLIANKMDFLSTLFSQNRGPKS